MRSMRPDPEIRVKKIAIPAGRRRTPALVLSPNEAPVLATGVLWIHGGGYILGMKEMVHMSRAVDLVKKVRGGGSVAGVSAGLCCALSGGAGRLPCGAGVNEVPRCRVGHPC